MARVEFVLQDAVFDGVMRGFADKPQRDEGLAIAGYGEANSIAGAFQGQSSAAGSVSQIAGLDEFSLRGLDSFMAGGGTMSAPTRAQRQARGVQPSAVFEFLHRHEERAGQD